MKKNPSAVIMLIVNALALFWLAYLATFDTAIKYMQDDRGGPVEVHITPYQFLIFPIFALLLCSFFFIRDMLIRRDKPIHRTDA